MSTTTDFASIKAKLVTILEADDDLDANSVFGYEPNIEGVAQDPFAVVVPSGNEADFGSTLENRREYAFSIRVFVARTEQRGLEGAETLLTEIIDRLIDRFDEDYTLSGSVLTALASPSAWGYIEGKNEYRTAEILLTVRTWFDVSV